MKAMKALAIAALALSYLSLSFAQGIQGRVTFNGKASVTVTGHSVILTWSSSQGATSYNIYRGSVSGGPYSKLATGVPTTTYTDAQVTSNQTWYYVTTAVSSGGESGYSNQVTAVIH